VAGEDHRPDRALAEIVDRPAHFPQCLHRAPPGPEVGPLSLGQRHRFAGQDPDQRRIAGDDPLGLVVVFDQSPEEEQMGSGLVVAEGDAVEGCEVADDRRFAVEVGELVGDPRQRPGGQCQHAQPPAALAGGDVDVPRPSFALLVFANPADEQDQGLLQPDRLLLVGEQRPQRIRTFLDPISKSHRRG